MSWTCTRNENEKTALSTSRGALPPTARLVYLLWLPLSHLQVREIHEMRGAEGPGSTVNTVRRDLKRRE